MVIHVGNDMRGENFIDVAVRIQVAIDDEFCASIPGDSSLHHSTRPSKTVVLGDATSGARTPPNALLLREINDLILYIATQ